MRSMALAQASHFLVLSAAAAGEPPRLLQTDRRDDDRGNLQSAWLKRRRSCDESSWPIRFLSCRFQRSGAAEAARLRA